MKGRHQRSLKKHGQPLSKVNPGPGSTEYRGPLRFPYTPRGDDAVPVRLAWNTSYFTAALSPNVNFSFANDPSVVVDWSNWAANYAEYRVLSTVLKWVPAYHNFVGATLGTTVTTPSPLYGTVVRNGTFAPTYSTTAFWQTAGCKVGTTDSMLTLKYAASSASEMRYTNVSAPGATATLSLYSPTGTSANYYGDVLVEMVVQFRNRN
jgi:hypothetical protein